MMRRRASVRVRARAGLLRVRRLELLQVLAVAGGELVLLRARVRVRVSVRVLLVLT